LTAFVNDHASLGGGPEQNGALAGKIFQPDDRTGRAIVRVLVLTVFLDEYEAEMRRLDASTAIARPEREVELAEIERSISTIKTAIMKGIDASLFVAELKQFEVRRRALDADTRAERGAGVLLHPDLGQIYREKVARLTDGYEEEVLKTQAFERIRALIEQVTLTPEDGALSVHLRGELASMLELCACGEMQNAPSKVSEGALQIKMVAGTRFGRCRTRFNLTRNHMIPRRRQMARSGYDTTFP
jgi:site-specific DNA recombinase